MLNNIWTMVLVSVSVALAILRIGGVTDEFFQAIAHFFVGGLIATAFVHFRSFNNRPLETDMLSLSKCGRNAGLAVSLTIIEVACALWFAFSGS